MSLFVMFLQLATRLVLCVYVCVCVDICVFACMCVCVCVCLCACVHGLSEGETVSCKPKVLRRSSTCVQRLQSLQEKPSVKKCDC